MKELIIKILQKALKKKKVELKKEEIDKILETPPSIEMGDYSFPCFFLVKKFKQEPKQIALEIKKKIGNSTSEFDDIQVSGPYINFFINRKNLAKKVILEVKTKKEKFGKNTIGKARTMIVEFSSPNIAKPFGIGHLRSTIIGNSISNISEFNGFKVIRMNYLGDWGTQFGKLLFGYKKFGNYKTLKSDPIKNFLDIYVKVNKNKKYEKPSREWFRKMENNDKEAISLWKKFRDLSLKEFKKIYSELGIKFDIYSSESLYSKNMDFVIEQLKKKNLLEKSDGAMIVNLEKYGLGVCLIQKSDGTTLYATRDLASTISRYNQFKFNKLIYEVGQEQKLHFAQIFKILELMGYGWAKNCTHIEHGLYFDKDGKKFATRKGKIIFMEDILNETKKLAAKEITKRSPQLPKKEIIKRAGKIAKAAIFYGDLKNNRINNIIFDIKRFVSFEGDTGPYIQYSYARASSILRKVKRKEKQFKINNLEDKEFELVKKLSQFSEVVLNSYANLNPSLIANYSYQLAQIFNEFYHACPVIGSKEKESFRIELVKTFRQVLKNSLYLLGIETIEEM